MRGCRVASVSLPCTGVRLAMCSGTVTLERDTAETDDVSGKNGRMSLFCGVTTLITGWSAVVLVGDSGNLSSM